MAQQTLADVQNVDPRTEIKEVWRTQASQNVTEHNILCAIDKLVVETTNYAIRNMSPLAHWDEYNQGI